MSFAELNLNEPLIKALAEAGYTEPTPVQAAAIPEILAGHDIMASAPTGTGKTAAFVLPALQGLAQPSRVQGRGPRLLVLTPTRELAMQVTTAAQKYGRFLPRFKAVSVVGGMPYPAQNRLLAAPMDVLVATPGRLMDQMERGRIDFSRLEMLVLDEADRMLDMGFIDDVEAIAAKLPAARQTLLFSATLDGPIARLAQKLLREPRRVQIAAARERHTCIAQKLIYADDQHHKLKLLKALLTDLSVHQAIVFTATKRDADNLASQLESGGEAAAALHGDMPQRKRTRVLDQLKRNRLRVLVATDVAARGIDVSTISHVINFDLPRSAEDYVHRIGRTGRAGQSGIAIAFVSSRDLQALRGIERYSGAKPEVISLPGLEARFKPGNGGGFERSGASRPRNPAHRHRGHASGNGDAPFGKPGQRPNWRAGDGPRHRKGGNQRREPGSR